MNTRERFLAVMGFEPVDRSLLWEMGYWGGTLRRWYQEGLPRSVGVPDSISEGGVVVGGGSAWDPVDRERGVGTDVDDYFALDEGMRRISLNNYFCPEFEETILEDHGDWVVWRSNMGVICQDRKDRTSVPKFVGWPVESRDDWERLKAERLQPSLDGRVPGSWPQLLSDYRERSYPLAIGGRHGFFGTPRYLLGEERVMFVFYDDPELIRDMVNYLADFWVALYDKVLSQTDADVALIWEDMSYKAGPMISPAMFREFLLPAYKKLTGCFRDHGIKHVLVDTDGDCWQLIPLFVEGGVTGVYPFEVNAGMDVVEVRKAFPRLQILGGLDKTKMTGGQAEMDAELRKAQALLPKGGYIPHFDHLVSMDVSWNNFVAYRTKLNQIVQSLPRVPSA